MAKDETADDMTIGGHPTRNNAGRVGLTFYKEGKVINSQIVTTEAFEKLVKEVAEGMKGN